MGFTFYVLRRPSVPENNKCIISKKKYYYADIFLYIGYHSTMIIFKN